MKRWLPFPRLSLALLAMWLLLQQSVAPGHLLLGTALAVFAPLATAALRPFRGRVRRPAAAIRLARRVVVDVIRSNFAVARIILGPRQLRHNSGFISIRLRLRDPYGLAVLASIVTATPGTLWVDYDSSRGLVSIHVLDLIDEDAWIAIITQRYERLLLEIFE